MRFAHGYSRSKSFRQFDGDPVAVAEHCCMRDAIELFSRCRIELWNSVAECCDPKRGDCVEVTRTVDVDELSPFGRLDDDWSILPVGRHLGEAMPHHSSIPVHPLIVGACQGCGF